MKNRIFECCFIEAKPNEEENILSIPLESFPQIRNDTYFVLAQDESEARAKAGHFLGKQNIDIQFVKIYIRPF